MEVSTSEQPAAPAAPAEKEKEPEKKEPKIIHHTDIRPADPGKLSKTRISLKPNPPAKTETPVTPPAAPPVAENNAVLNEPQPELEAPQSEPFTLEKAWADFSAHLVAGGKKNAGFLMKTHYPKENHEGMLLIEVKSPANQEILEQVKHEFAEFCVQRGAPYRPNFRFFLNPDKVENLKPYTEKEKLEAMMRKSPVLQKLVMDLKLRVD